MKIAIFAKMYVSSHYQPVKQFTMFHTFYAYLVKFLRFYAIISFFSFSLFFNFKNNPLFLRFNAFNKKFVT